jgi:hypothetical protein
MVNSDFNLDDAEASCIDSCLEAAQACEWCIEECDDGEMEDCVRACRDAAALTTLCARLIARQSSYIPEIAAVCAVACDTCADVCEQYEREHVEACFELCIRCADTCRKLA